MKTVAGVGVCGGVVTVVPPVLEDGGAGEVVVLHGFTSRRGVFLPPGQSGPPARGVAGRGLLSATLVVMCVFGK